ncbi:MAG: hypothetical protein PHH70_05665 [Candidatus Gracilibacteria bacterium]|nr:hypothetical protein [Candidatus Gracilibacteria bacterium]
MTKYFTVLIITIMTGMVGISNTYAFYTHDYFQNIGVTYELTASDHTVVNAAIAKIEAVVAKKGESYRSRIVSQLREYALANFNNNVRMSTIFGTVIASLKQTGKDKTTTKTATGTIVYTQAESLLKNGAGDLKNLSVTDIKKIADDKSTVKLLVGIGQKLQGDTLTACTTGTSGDDPTLICEYDQALNYLKYLYFSSETITNYSIVAEDRAYANKSIALLEKIINEVISQEPSGDPILYGTYGGANKFYKMEIFMEGNVFPGGQITFVAHPDMSSSSGSIQ